MPMSLLLKLELGYLEFVNFKRRCSCYKKDADNCINFCSDCILMNEYGEKEDIKDYED